MSHPASAPIRTLLLFALGLAAAAPAFAQRLAEVEVIDRDTRETLRQHWFEGRRYVVGKPGHAYEIAVRNQSGERLLAVMSVDGVNVLSGETAGPYQGGYVFDPGERDTIRGWRKTLEDVAQFRFTSLPNSYAARTGRPDDVGVIGVALFREARRYWPQDHYGYDDGWRGRDGRDDYRGKSAPAPDAREESARDGAAPSTSSKSAPQSKSRRQDAPLGTAHGRREYAPVGTTTFERASSEPDEVITIFYDSRSNLAAAGVLPARYEYSRRRPQAFPNGFVPDP